MVDRCNLGMWVEIVVYQLFARTPTFSVSWWVMIGCLLCMLHWKIVASAAVLCLQWVWFVWMPLAQFVDDHVIGRSSVSLLKWLVTPESNDSVFPCRAVLRWSCFNRALASVDATGGQVTVIMGLVMAEQGDSWSSGKQNSLSVKTIQHYLVSKPCSTHSHSFLQDTQVLG